MDGVVILAIIFGFAALLAYGARSTVRMSTDHDANPKRPVRGYRGVGGGPGINLIDPGAVDGNSRALE